MGVGVLFLIAQLALIKTIFGSGKWPTASGQIITSSIDGPTYGKYGPQYGADISYQYSVGGATYVSDVVNPIMVYHETLAESQELVQQYPLGKSVKVYYNPDDPYNAVLVPVASPANGFIGCLALIFLGSGCLAIWKRLTISRTNEGPSP